MKIYISGRITGTQPDEYMPKFQAAEQALIEAGVSPSEIVNPTKLGIPVDGSWSVAKDRCLEALKPCTAIYMLRDWRESIGARHELTEAGYQRKDVYFEAHNDIQMISECKKAGVL